jgi:Holliday junction resolvase RusA-like endonuclease
MGDGAGGPDRAGLLVPVLEPAPPLIHLRIPGEPRGKGRPRVGRFKNVYTPDETIRQEERIRLAWENAGSPRIDGLITISLDFCFARPSSHFLKDGSLSAAGRRATPGGIRDWDNLAKLCTDALNGLAFEDDRLVCRAEVTKYWEQDEHTSVTITPWPWPDDLELV